MAWRYRKSIKIHPGVRLNLSKRGISTTVGVRGASVNFSKRGTYVNTGIPGTGIYNRVKLPNEHSTAEATHGVALVAEAPHIRRYKHRLWPWWIFGTFAVALLQNPTALQIYWALLVVAWLFRMALGKKYEPAVSEAEPQTPPAAQ